MKTETLKNVLGVVGKVAAIGTLLALSRATKVEYVVNNDDRTVGYYDAVRSIMATSMFASDKRACVSVMRRDAGSDYYRAVIEIAQSSMFGSDKIAAIKML
jgi:hypothetical protein